jgi:hypothetical protein
MSVPQLMLLACCNHRCCQCTVEDLCCELDEERAARRGMEAQLVTLQKQVRGQREMAECAIHFK